MRKATVCEKTKSKVRPPPPKNARFGNLRQMQILALGFTVRARLILFNPSRAHNCKMAWRMKVKLPTLKVTQRSCSGPTVYRNIPKGRSTASTSLVQDTSGPEAEESECQYETSDDLFSSEPMLSETALGCSDVTGQNVSLHAVKEQASASAWAQIRSLLRTAAVECSAMPTNQSCIMCLEVALYRCLVWCQCIVLL